MKNINQIKSMTSENNMKTNIILMKLKLILSELILPFMKSRPTIIICFKNFVKLINFLKHRKILILEMTPAKLNK